MDAGLALPLVRSPPQIGIANSTARTTIALRLLSMPSLRLDGRTRSRLAPAKPPSANLETSYEFQTSTPPMRRLSHAACSRAWWCHEVPWVIIRSSYAGSTLSVDARHCLTNGQRDHPDRK